MCQPVLAQAKDRALSYMCHSLRASAMLKEIPFLPDLEAGIRAAWRHDRVASPLRGRLMTACVFIHPFVGDHASFISLLDEIPEFTAQYVKALLGCRDEQRPVPPVFHGQIQCYVCGKTIFDDRGLQAIDVFFLRPPYSARFGHRFPGPLCSSTCVRKMAADSRQIPGT